MTARTIMVQGTASSVGKSIITAALCRIFRQRGLRVAPFKSQNMALNAFVTPAGGEIGRAQAVQAVAAGICPTVDMNPILLKPEGDARSQVVVLGTPIGSLGAVDYQAHKPELRDVIAGSLARLRAANDVVVIEGAGSPAEVNLKARDIVNMFVAELADAPVLLVGDIDRGGVLAAFVGTLALLEPDERKRVAAFVINKFRGDLQLLVPGLDFLYERTGVPVLGVLPYIRQLGIADEDSVSLDDRRLSPSGHRGDLVIVVVRLPRISNHDDFQPLEHEPGVSVRFVDHVGGLVDADLIVLPGSKSTIADLQWLRDTGFAEALSGWAKAGGLTLGVCGGCQMLGTRIADPESIESDLTGDVGLGLLPIETRFVAHKRTSQVCARPKLKTFLARDLDEKIVGYEIHMGRVRRIDGCRGVFSVRQRNGSPSLDTDGAVSSEGTVVGTMIHGLFENSHVRESLLATLRARRGMTPVAKASSESRVNPVDAFDRLAGIVEEHVDMRQLFALIGRDIDDQKKANEHA